MHRKTGQKKWKGKKEEEEDRIHSNIPTAPYLLYNMLLLDVSVAKAEWSPWTTIGIQMKYPRE